MSSPFSSPGFDLTTLKRGVNLFMAPIVITFFANAAAVILKYPLSIAS
jgi:hypothetical protein